MDSSTYTTALEHCHKIQDALQKTIHTMEMSQDFNIKYDDLNYNYSSNYQILESIKYQHTLISNQCKFLDYKKQRYNPEQNG